MGTLSNYCRLCANMVPSDQQVHLSNNEEDDLTVKIKFFLGIELSEQDFSEIICSHCFNSLQFCFQFVDRCRHIHYFVMEHSANLDSLHADLTYRYPYLYQSQNFLSSTNGLTYPNCREAGGGPAHLLGPTKSGGQPPSQSNSQRSRILRHENASGSTVKSSSENFIMTPSMETSLPLKETSSTFFCSKCKRSCETVADVVVEVEPSDLFFDRRKMKTKLAATSNLATAFENDSATMLTTATTSSARSMRKILPKASSDSSGLSNPDCLVAIKNIPSQQQQIMIPITLKTPCRHCGIIICASSVNDIKNHICSKEKNVSCPEEDCAKKFTTKLALKYHLKHYHKISKASANQHLEHQPVNPRSEPSVSHQQQTSKLETSSANRQGKFQCRYAGCSKVYNLKNYLVEHERKHTGEKPFECENCSMKFFRILDKKKHLLLKVCE